MDDTVARAKARINRMNQTAEELARELGLPADAKYAVLSTVYASKEQVQVRVPSEAIQGNNDENLKNLIYQHVETFLRHRMKKQVEVFQAIWEELKFIPLETLARGFGQTQTTGGLGFAGGSQDLSAVISTISWVVVQASDTATKKKLSMQRIAQEALARGCSPAQSQALAQYLYPQLRHL